MTKEFLTLTETHRINIGYAVMLMEVKNVFKMAWCAYAHFVNGECVYIGWGEIWRAFHPRDRSRGWCAVTRGHRIDVQILTQHHKRLDAIESARLLILLQDPPGNRSGSGLPRGRKSAALRCIETGVEYVGPTEAARAANISVSTMNAHLAGRLKSAGGHRFERIPKQDA